LQTVQIEHTEPPKQCLLTVLLRTDLIKSVIKSVYLIGIFIKDFPGHVR